MGKFLLGVLTGFALVFLGFVFLIVIAFAFRGHSADVSSNSVLILHLQGEIPEKPPVELPEIIGGDHPGATVTGLWQALRNAAADSRIKAILLEPENITAGWAKLEELRGDLENFRKSGKPIYAYLRNPAGHEYYLATAADRIYTSKSDLVMLRGMRAELMYFKKTLDKLGVTVEVQHAGKYKDYGDMFTRSDMSPETREVMDSLVDDLYGNFVSKIAAARHRTPDQVRNIMDQGPFTAPQALNAGLIDDLKFEDEMWSDLKARLNSGEPHRVGLDEYLKVTPESLGLGGGRKIAVLVAEGDIVRGQSGDNGSDENSLTSYGFDKLLRKVRNDSSIQAAIVRVDSPGGEVVASEEIWREMSLLSHKKPVVISFSDVAASGGYDMSMTGDPIVAYPQTETGSIGVVFGKPDLHGLYDKLGITKDAVQRGKHADIESDYTALTPEERDMLQRGIDESYHEFVAKVAAARHRTYDQIEPLAQGRVWLGDQAKERGLVDALGGLDTAIAMVKQKANIPANSNVSLVMYPGRRSLLDMLLRRSSDDPLEMRLSQVFGRMPYHAWMKGGMLRILPYWITVQ